MSRREISSSTWGCREPAITAWLWRPRPSFSLSATVPAVQLATAARCQVPGSHNDLTEERRKEAVSDGVARATDLQSTVENPILRISYDAERDFLWAVPPDAVIDGHMDDEMDEPLEGLFLYRRGPDGAVFGFGVDDAFGWEVMGNVDDSSGLLWGDELCFDVPTLALRPRQGTI